MSESSAPSRPPAVSFVDPEQSFFRAWALRSSDHEQSDPSSTSSTPISPKTVPKTVLARAKKASYQAQYSEASQQSEGTRESEPTLSAPWRRAHTLGFGDNPQLTLTKPSVGGLPVTLSSRRPSSILGNRAQKLLRIHARGSADSTKSASDSTASPSKEAKNDYKWKREISGHWFQIRTRRSRRSERRSERQLEGRLRNKSEEATPAVPDVTMTANTPQQGISSNHHYGTPVLPTLGQKEGLYGRVKRKIGLSQEPAESAHDEISVKTLTGEILNRASSILRPLAERNGTPPSSSASDSMNGPGSNPSIAGSHHNRIARLLPFHHHRPGNSSSSSIRDMKMAEAPQATPEAHALYTGSDKEQYFRVEFSDPDAPTFLPSEARRIGTPPLRDNTLRGFFFDYKNPEGEVACSPSPEAVEGSPTQVRRPRRKRNDNADWYKVKMEALEAQDAQSQEFVLVVPEHLSNSPLCPRHPKHPSGGKGVCVYHGRNIDQE
ncbi:accessory factor associated with RNA polymerase II [Peltigera leucophlebia]|nr:accessory factor associated with RNA polymerase II [Peltigera leucophlebia]